MKTEFGFEYLSEDEVRDKNAACTFGFLGPCVGRIMLTIVFPKDFICEKHFANVNQYMVL